MSWRMIIYMLSALGSLDDYLCKEIGTENDRDICRLESADYLERCTAENGSHLSIESSLVVPAFSVCTFRYGTSLTLKQCDENGEFLPLGNHLTRQKRFLTTIGAAVGSIFGPVGTIVGAVIGLVADFFVGLCIVFCGHKEHQDPPEIFCGHVEQSVPIYAAKGTETVKISWTKPTATDDEDGQLNGKVRKITNYNSGNSFPAGRYSVLYSVTDSTNRKDTCTIDFEVKLIVCPQTGKPENGMITCDFGHKFGSKCIVTCNPGYELDMSDSNTTECADGGAGDGYWSNTIPNCKAKPCEKPWPVVKRGGISCTNNIAAYDKTCKVYCESGYVVEGDDLASCEVSGIWKKINAYCKDVASPKFTSCPDGIQVNIDSANNTANVSWDLPSGNDNSGVDPVIKEIHNYIPGQIFNAGTYSIQYDIKDQAGNTGKSCSFGLQVQTISCQPPNLNVTGAEHMSYECPYMYRLGAVCSLSCRSGYPLGGVTEITCQNDDDSDPPVLRWKWDINGLEPFCKVTPCPDLKAPGHGALACSLWEHGNMCQMQCEKGFDTPIIRDGMFVCGQSDGLWRPDDNVPDCIPKKNAHQMNLKSELFYYTGRCNSSKENLREIQENFVKALNSSKFHEFCVGVPECQGRFVNVTCGAIEDRRKRDTRERVVKRQTKSQFAYAIEFELLVPYVEKPGKTSLESFSEHQNRLYDMIDAVETDVNSGHFRSELNDLHIGKHSLKIGRPMLSCPVGEMPRTETGSCVGCPKGKFFSTEVNDCQYCPIGTFQDTPGSVSCKPCPKNSNTTGEGATNRTQCKEYCAAGYFSTSGTVPCQKCPSSMFQPDHYQTSCIPCGNGLRTVTEGSSKKEDCQVYDITVRSGKPVKFMIDKNLSETTLLAWLRIKRTNPSRNILVLNSTKSDFTMTIKNRRNLYLDIDGRKTEFNGAIQENEWTSFIMTVDALADTVKLYLDGTAIVPNGTVAFLRHASFAEGDMLAIDADISISRFYILDRVISSSEITSYSSTCMLDVNDSVYTTDSLLASHTAMIVIPSVCDAVNECKSNPCGNHTCINGNGTYECVCNGGYSGKNCELPPDYCIGHKCLNGATCINGQTDYTCKCAYAFKGSLCEMNAVNGKWSDWTSWTSCSKSCGGGIAARSRQCDSPPPDVEGQECKGFPNDTKACNIQKCPECITLPDSFGVTMTCNETEFLKRCAIACRPGLFFATSPLKYYECGILTNYTWNHQTEENPTGRLPVCTEAKPPKNMDVTFDGRYETISCNTKNISLVNARLQPTIDNIECVKQGYCIASIANIICEDDGKRRKRSTGKALRVTIELKSNVQSDGSGYNIKELLQNNTAPSSDLVAFVKQSFSLEASAQKLFNDSINFFRVTIDGTNHTIGTGENGISFSSSVQCPSGSIPVDAFCAECPIGSYSDGKTVTMCPRGQYQDREGQSSCKSCPAGYTTLGIGSVLVSECSESIESPRNSESSPIKVVVGVSVSVGVLIVAVAVAVFVFKYKGKGQSKVDSSFNEMPCRQYTYAEKPVFDKSALM